MNPPRDDKPSILKTERIIQIFRPRSFSRYFIVGGANTLAGVVVFAILYWIIGNYVNVNIILIINWIVNNLIGFVLHKIVTFESAGSVYEQIPKFLALSLLSLATHMAVLNVVLYFVKLNPIIIVMATNFILAAVFMIINYFSMHKFIFSKGGV